MKAWRLKIPGKISGFHNPYIFHHKMVSNYARKPNEPILGKKKNGRISRGTLNGKIILTLEPRPLNECLRIIFSMHLGRTRGPGFQSSSISSVQAFSCNFPTILVSKMGSTALQLFLFSFYYRKR